MKTKYFSLSILIIFALYCNNFAATTPPYYGDNPCGTSLTTTSCALIVQNANIDNISHSLVSGGANPGNRVDFRDKSNPGTYYWFTSGTDPQLAKSILSVLLTAKSSGSNVKFWIVWSSGAGDSRNFSSATLVDP